MLIDQNRQNKNLVKSIKSQPFVVVVVASLLLLLLLLLLQSMGNQLTQLVGEHDVGEQVASGGPGNLWKIYDARRKSTRERVSLFVRLRTRSLSHVKHHLLLVRVTALLTDPRLCVVFDRFV
jgi:hypothetical protein